MSALPKIVYWTPKEYLAMERKAKYKSEYFNGQIIAMAGASKRHNLITTNVSGEFYLQFKKRSCEVYSSDMRVKVSESGLYTYPDVVAVCDRARFDDTQKDTLLNPTVIVHVLSNSTKGYDLGTKFAHYRKLDSLQEYLVISQTKYHVEHYVRQPNKQWLLSEYESLSDIIELPSINCQLAMTDIYDKIELVIVK